MRGEEARDRFFEFQMLYGIRRDLQQSLVQDGWRMRVYIPFGAEWYPYFMRRLGEHPTTCSSLSVIYGSRFREPKVLWRMVPWLARPGQFQVGDYHC